MAHLYNEETISQAIDTKWAGKTVHFAKETDSTNSWIKRLAKDGAEHGTLAVAEFQSAGRGRFDRRWEAPDSFLPLTIGIWFPFILSPSTSIHLTPFCTPFGLWISI